MTRYNSQTSQEETEEDGRRHFFPPLLDATETSSEREKYCCERRHFERTPSDQNHSLERTASLWSSFHVIKSPGGHRKC